MLILSVGGPDPAGAAKLLADPPRGVGAVEVRLDLLGRPSLEGFDPSSWRRRSLRRIATCRSRRHGGGFTGSEQERAALLAAAASAGFDYVDVEWATAAAKRLLSEAAGRVILSWHDARGTPPIAELRALHRRLSEVPGAAVVKFVPTARRALDVLAIRDLLAGARRRGRPLAAFAMGPCGVVSRLLAGAWGSWGSYVCAERGAETAPGQLTLEEALRTFRSESITADTRLTGIVGDPVGHSFSPLVHNAAYGALGMDWRYVPIPLGRASEVAALIGGLRLRGVSVTAPHKVAAIRSVHSLDPRARRAGAINTILRGPGGLRGFNTDLEGIAAPVVSRVDPAGRVALILGAGGAARAAAVALADRGAKVVVASRRARPGAAVAYLVGGRRVPYESAAGVRWEILINATPVGGDGRGLPLPASSIRWGLVGDLVYRVGGTPLVRLARRRGLPAFGGEEVLMAQALEQFRLFTGREGPRGVMRSALARALGAAARGIG